MELTHIFSPEAENSILASFLFDEATRHLIESLKPTDFYDPINRRAFEAIRGLYRTNRPIDLLVLCEVSKIDMERLTAYETHTSILSEHHIDLLKNKAARREFQAAQLKISELLKLDSHRTELKNSILKVIEDVEIGSKQVDGSLRAVLMSTFDNLQKKDTAYKSGIDELDRRTGGFHRGEMTIIAARPARGKTAVALQISQSMAQQGLTVLFISREMSQIQLGKRILASNSRIDGFKLRSNNLDTKEWERVTQKMGELCDLPIIFDTESVTVPEIKARVRKEKADIVFVDYLQLLKPTQRETAREREVAQMSREFKNISLEMDMPVIVLSQLNRTAEENRPSLAAIRESGAIEQDADTIIFLHRPNNAEINEALGHDKLSRVFIDKIKENGWDIFEFIIGKQRNGATGLFYMIYESKFLNFIGILNKE